MGTPSGLGDLAGSRMTLEGSAFKTGILLLLTLAGAGYTWHLFFQQQGNPGAVVPLMIGGGIVGFIVSMICIFKPTTSPMLAPVYALAEGLFLGGISASIEARYPGVALQAVMATFGTLAALLVAYTTRMIRATENFKLGVVAATGGICLMYLGLMIMRLFGMEVGFLNNNPALSIGISVVIVIVAALNLVLDFDFIEEGAARGAPKYMEWYAALGLMLTLVWLYIELLKLFAKLSKKD
ncbi:MAG: Bax inhibitor-1/YccA family protein [Planctomycetales bacterium]